MTTTEPDPWRKFLVPQPRKKTDVDMLIQNIKTGLEELEASLPPDKEDDDEDSDEDNELDSPDLVAYKKSIADLLRRSRRKR